MFVTIGLVEAAVIFAGLTSGIHRPDRHSLTFANRGLSSIGEDKRREARGPGDIAVFPLAFPLIAGPGGLSAIVLLMGRSEGLVEVGAILLMLVARLVITYAAMRAWDLLVVRLGDPLNWLTADLRARADQDDCGAQRRLARKTVPFWLVSPSIRSADR